MASRDTFVAISLPRCSPSLVRAAQVLEELGVAPVPLVTRGLESRLAAAGVNLANAIVVDDLSNAASARVEILSALQARGVRLTNWVNLADDVSETFLATVHVLLPHLSFDAYRKCRVKCLARRILHDQGLVQAPPIVANTDRPRLDITHGAVIAKPITGSGSELVRRLRDQRDWEAYTDLWFRQKLPHGLSGDQLCPFGGFDPYSQALIEPEFQGLELRADGFVAKSNVSICAIAVRVTNASDVGFREVGGAAYSARNNNQWGTFEQWVSDVLVALRFDSGVFHLEAIQLADGSFELIEINPRVGGGGCSVVTQRVSGVDLVRENVRLWLGLPPNARPHATQTPTIVYAIAYDHRDGIVARVAAEQEVNADDFGLSIWLPFVSAGESIHGSVAEHYLGELHCALGERDVLLPDDVRSRVQYGLQWIKQRHLVEVATSDRSD